MQIESINPQPIVEIPFLNAGRGSGSFRTELLPVLEATVDRLPDGLDAIIATADLQGREPMDANPGRPPRLLGETLPFQLCEEVLPSLSLNYGRIGVILAGDFYTVPTLDRLGGSGDVSEVWEAFGFEFDWVTGVAGNHDMFGPSRDDLPSFSGNIHYLDADRKEIDGLKIAGLGGIIGKAGKLHRRPPEEYVAQLKSILQEETDILILHDGPDDPANKQVGIPIIREAVEKLRPKLVIRGHAYWQHPLAELSSGVQVLNVDSRVVIMRQ